MDYVGELILAGTKRGGEDMLQSIFRSLFWGLPLPSARRKPKRLKEGKVSWENHHQLSKWSKGT